MEKTRIVKNLEEETVNKEDEKVNEEEEMETQKEKNDSKDESNGEQSNWALASPDKVDRFPGSHQREDFHISASKFSVLSMGEEEEVEILEGRKLVDDTETDVVIERKEG